MLKLQFLNADPYAMCFTFSTIAVTRETCADPERLVRGGPTQLREPGGVVDEGERGSNCH